MHPPVRAAHKVEKGLAVLICSDGFWEYVNETEMQETLCNSSDSRGWLEAMHACLKEKVGEYNDNYSAICLKINNRKR